MSSLLTRAARFLDRTLHGVAAEDVVYTRGGTSIEIEAIPGSRNALLDEIEGEQASSVDFDWIISADNLLIGGVKVEPQKGDTIVWIDARDNTRTYKVLPDDNERCFRPVDQLGLMYRIHTKLVEVS